VIWTQGWAASTTRIQDGDNKWHSLCNLLFFPLHPVVMYELYNLWEIIETDLCYCDVIQVVYWNLHISDRCSCCVKIPAKHLLVRFYSAVQIDSGKVRTEESRHSGLLSFIRRSSLGDKKPFPSTASSGHQTVTATESAAVAAPPVKQQNNDGTYFPLIMMIKIVFFGLFCMYNQI